MQGAWYIPSWITGFFRSFSNKKEKPDDWQQADTLHERRMQILFSVNKEFRHSPHNPTPLASFVQTNLLPIKLHPSSITHEFCNAKIGKQGKALRQTGGECKINSPWTRNSGILSQAQPTRSVLRKAEQCEVAKLEANANPILCEQGM